MDLVARRARRGAENVEFTPREFELLEYLLRHKEQVVSREMLAREVWRETSRGAPLDSVIDVHMARLRHKIDEQFDHKLIHTIRGVGYVLREKR
jgi:DNA-binding response OmpR family regulator